MSAAAAADPTTAAVLSLPPAVADARQSDASAFSSHSAIVIDQGSWQCRAGWSGEAQPRLVFPTVVAAPRNPKVRITATSFSN